MGLLCLASDFRHRGNQLLTVPHCLELFWDREFSLQGKNRNLLLETGLRRRPGTPPTASGISSLGYTLSPLLYHKCCLFCPKESRRKQQLPLTASILSKYLKSNQLDLLGLTSDPQPPQSTAWNCPSRPGCRRSQRGLRTLILPCVTPGPRSHLNPDTYKVATLGGNKDIHLG